MSRWQEHAKRAGWTPPPEPKKPRPSAARHLLRCTACDTAQREMCPVCCTMVFVCEGVYSRCGGCNFQAFACNECGGTKVTGAKLDEHQRHGFQHARGRS